jgi:hypothetical protein
MAAYTGRRFGLALGTLLLGLCLAASSSLQASTARASTPDEPAQAPTDFKLVGEARLKVLLWSVYDSRLYTADGRYEAGQRPLRLEIEYLLDIPAANLVKRTRSEWAAMGREHPRQEAWLREVSDLWPDISAGDTLTLELAGDGRALFRFNGEVLGSVDDPEFGQQFADIWLSPETTRPEVRLALLGRD